MLSLLFHKYPEIPAVAAELLETIELLLTLCAIRFALLKSIISMLALCLTVESELSRPSCFDLAAGELFGFALAVFASAPCSSSELFRTTIVKLLFPSRFDEEHDEELERVVEESVFGYCSSLGAGLFSFIGLSEAGLAPALRGEIKHGFL